METAKIKVSKISSEFYEIELTLSLHNNCEWTIASGNELLQDEIQEYRLNFAEEQNELKGEIFLHQL